MGMKDFSGAIGAWYNEVKDYDYNNPGKHYFYYNSH